MLAHVPTWVYGLFALLLALGLLFTRPRAVHPVVPSLMAVGFGCYSLYGVISSFGASLTNILPWAIGMAVSAFLGRPYFGPKELSRVAGSPKVLVPGSWLPLALMMGIFAVKFFVGVVRGAHLAVGTEAWFAPAVCLVLGLLSGGFTTRGLNVRRYVQATAAGVKPLVTTP
jgi:hypothetical protein